MLVGGSGPGPGRRQGCPTPADPIVTGRRSRGKEPAPPPCFQQVSTAATGLGMTQQEAFRVHVEPEIEVLLRAAVADPAEEHADREFSLVLADAIARLDPRYRAVLLLIDVVQLTYAQTAAALDVPIGTVMSRLSRARDKMRRELRDAPPEEGPPTP